MRSKPQAAHEERNKVMNKLFVAASATALLVASASAGHADEATGSISAIDPVGGTVTLADGSIYALPSPEDVAALSIGQEVTIIYEQGSDGTLRGSDVMPKS